MLLSVENLRTWFELRKWGFFHVGRIKAVDGVSFQVEKGESVAIVGESGCGKSTLARTLLRLYDPVAGSIFFKGENIADFSGRKKKSYLAKMGYIQQDPYGALPPFMNIRRIIEEPMIIHGVKGRQKRLDAAVAALEELNLTPPEEILPKFPHMLSGGQQQRIVIARACALNPDLLVADEPISMLDASVRISILKLLNSMQKAHDLALIYVTHDLSTVRYFSDRILVMYAGRIIEQAGVEVLLSEPAHPYTQALIASIPDPDAANAKAMRSVPPGEPPSLADPPAGCRYHPRCKHKIEGKCDVQIPLNFELGRGHGVECWLYDDD